MQNKKGIGKLEYHKLKNINEDIVKLRFRIMGLWASLPKSACKLIIYELFIFICCFGLSLWVPLTIWAFLMGTHMACVGKLDKC